MSITPLTGIHLPHKTVHPGIEFFFFVFFFFFFFFLVSKAFMSFLSNIIMFVDNEILLSRISRADSLHFVAELTE